MKDSAILRQFISIFTLFVEATTRTQAEECVLISLLTLSVMASFRSHYYTQLSARQQRD
ncbi:unnamed protein product, partial [Rotaria magnacalcarata]